MIKKFKRKQIVVDAIRLTKTNKSDVLNFAGLDAITHLLVNNRIAIPVLRGGVNIVCPGDWVVKKENGELCSYKHSVFIENYESYD